MQEETGQLLGDEILKKVRSLRVNWNKLQSVISLHEKCPYLELLWSVFSRIWTEYGVYLRIQSKCGKIPTRITPNTYTFYEVFMIPSNIHDGAFCENREWLAAICQGPKYDSGHVAQDMFRKKMTIWRISALSRFTVTL